ncbi:MAG TPA: PEP/pyruvate-binding domain-containing protein, partial [Arthrobacter sp.]|nr:PEP/pyruvate-binding domain-containing protein [Arthrobacter sp.]
MAYINQFDDVGEGDLAAVGGKGVGLGGLIRAGVPVPAGFMLNTEAYAAFVDANQLAAGIQELAILGPQATMQ